MRGRKGRMRAELNLGHLEENASQAQAGRTCSARWQPVAGRLQSTEQAVPRTSLLLTSDALGFPFFKHEILHTGTVLILSKCLYKCISRCICYLYPPCAYSCWQNCGLDPPGPDASWPDRSSIAQHGHVPRFATDEL